MGSAADASASWSGTGRARMRPRISTIVLVFFAVTITVAVVGMSAAQGLLAWDVRFAYLPAAEAVLDGDSPYPALDDPILEDQKGYVYPPQLLLALVPFTPLPNGVVGSDRRRGPHRALAADVAHARHSRRSLLRRGAALGSVVKRRAPGEHLDPARVRGSRCLALPGRVWQPAWALGLAISAKFLMWPLLVWTIATRRLRATAGRSRSASP